MEIVKTTEEYQIIKKRSGRYGVRSLDRTWVSGEDKEKILVAEGLIKSTAPQAAPEAPAEEAPEEGASEDAPSEETDESSDGEATE